MSIIKLGNSNPKIKELKQMLSNNKIKDKVVTDDLTVIKVAFENNIEFLEFIFIEDCLYHNETQELIDKITKISKEVYSTTKSVFEKLAQKENAVGLIAVLKLNTLYLEDMKKYNYLIITDKLEIPGNLGTIYRTLDSAAADGIILVDPITKLNNTKLASSARGANLIVPTAEGTYIDVQNWLLENNYTIYLGEPNLGNDYQHYDYKGKIAIVVGNERFGINENWYKEKHEKVFIPMFGSNNSLNVGVAASIIIYEATMKRKKAQLLE